MSTSQYTIRNIPEQVDRYLRRRAELTGQSLNQVVVNELAEKAGVQKTGLVNSLDWFIGGCNIGEDVEEVLEEEDLLQKKLTLKQWRKNGN
jgi:hypothetical protein